MGQADPLVSIVTPSYNQGRFLEETIRSVLSQDYPKPEYLVIDGGSTDESVEIIKQHERHLAYWVSERDQGQSHAINKGFSRARGQIVAWLNSDDVYFSRTTVSSVVEAFQHHPEADVVYGDTALVTPDGRIYRIVPSMKRISFARLAFYCPSQGASFLRRDVVRRFPLREDLHTRMDYEYWMRLARAGARFVYLPKILEAFRVHPESKTAATGCGLDEELFQIKRHYFDGAWAARWPMESVLRRGVGLWLRLRGLGRAQELYGASLAFHGQRLPRVSFYRRQLFSRTFSEQ